MHNFQFVGSEYGGHWVIVDGPIDWRLVIDCGIGKDDSFAEGVTNLPRKGGYSRPVTILALDPSNTTKELYSKKRPALGIVYLPLAAAKHDGYLIMSKGVDCSDSIEGSGMPRMSEETYYAPCVSLRSLITVNRPELVKLDVEGMEFDLLEECFGVRQIVVEFHTGDGYLVGMREEQKMLLQQARDYGYEVFFQGGTDYVLLLSDEKGANLEQGT